MYCAGSLRIVTTIIGIFLWNTKHVAREKAQHAKDLKQNYHKAKENKILTNYIKKITKNFNFNCKRFTKKCYIVNFCKICVDYKFFYVTIQHCEFTVTSILYVYEIVHIIYKFDVIKLIFK